MTVFDISEVSYILKQYFGHTSYSYSAWITCIEPRKRSASTSTTSCCRRSSRARTATSSSTCSPRSGRTSATPWRAADFQLKDIKHIRTSILILQMANVSKCHQATNISAVSTPIFTTKAEKFSIKFLRILPGSGEFQQTSATSWFKSNNIPAN